MRRWPRCLRSAKEDDPAAGQLRLASQKKTALSKAGYSPFTTRAFGVRAEVNKAHMTVYGVVLHLELPTLNLLHFGSAVAATASLKLAYAWSQNGGSTISVSRNPATSVWTCAVKFWDKQTAVFVLGSKEITARHHFPRYRAAVTAGILTERTHRSIQWVPVRAPKPKGKLFSRLLVWEQAARR